MDVFADEASVRARFQLGDAAPVEVIAAGIAEAHEAVLARLSPEVDLASAPEGLVRGETLLAGARVLTALASGDAASQQDMTVGGQRIGPGARFASLLAMASQAEAAAWEVLGPYLAAQAGEAPGMATETAPVLGGEE